MIDGNTYDLYVLTCKNSKGYIYKYRYGYNGNYSKVDNFEIKSTKGLQNLALNKDYILALASDLSVVAYKKDGTGSEKTVNISSLNLNSSFDTITKIYLNIMTKLSKVVLKGEDETKITDLYVRDDKLYVLAKNHFDGKTSSKPEDTYAGTSNGAIIRFDIKSDELDSDSTFYSSQNNPHYGHTEQPASEEKRRSAFYGPSRFICITKDALFIADEGGHVNGIGESYVDVNRIVKIDLSSLRFEVVGSCASSFSGQFSEGTDTVTISGKTVKCGKFSKF